MLYLQQKEEEDGVSVKDEKDTLTTASVAVAPVTIKVLKPLIISC